MRHLSFCELFARFLGGGWPLAARAVRAYKFEWFIPLSTSNCADWPCQTNKAVWVARWVVLHISHGGRKAWSGRRCPSGFCRFVVFPGRLCSQLIVAGCLFVVFFLWLSRRCEIMCVWNCVLSRVLCPSPGWQKMKGTLMELRQTGEPKCSEAMPQCQFVHHQTYTGSEPRPSQWKSGDLPLRPCLFFESSGYISSDNSSRALFFKKKGEQNGGRNGDT